MRNSYWLDLCFNMLLEYIPEDFSLAEATGKFRSVIAHIDVIGEYFYAVKTELSDDVAKFFSMAGIGHKEISNYNTALYYYSKAESIRLNNNNEKALALVYNNIAVVYNIKAEQEKALEYYFKSLDISRKFNEPPMNLVITYNNITNVYLSNYSYAEANKWNSKALELVESSSLADNPLCADVFFTQSTIYYVNEDFSEALKLDFKALDLLREHFMEEHTDVGMAYNCIAREYFSLKEYPVALDYYLKAYRIYAKVYGDEDSDTAEVCGSIARTYSMLDDNADALKWCLKAMQTQEKIFGDEHPEVMLRHSFITDIYENMGLFNEVIEHLLIIRNFFIKKNHTEPLKDLNGRIADNYEKLGKLAEAKRFRKIAMEA